MIAAVTAPDEALPPGVAIPLAIVVTIVYLIVRARQDRRERREDALDAGGVTWCVTCNGYGMDAGLRLCHVCAGLGGLDIASQEPRRWPAGITTERPLTPGEIDAFLARWEATRG